MLNKAFRTPADLTDEELQLLDVQDEERRRAAAAQGLRALIADEEQREGTLTVTEQGILRAQLRIQLLEEAAKLLVLEQHAPRAPGFPGLDHVHV
jgi:hypothetical protein